MTKAPEQEGCLYKKLSDVPFGITVLCKFHMSSWKNIVKFMRICASPDGKAFMALMEFELDHLHSGTYSRRIAWFDALDSDEKYKPFSVLDRIPEFIPESVGTHGDTTGTHGQP